MTTTDQKDKVGGICQDRAAKAMEIIKLLDNGQQDWENEAFKIIRIALAIILPYQNVAIRVG